MSLDDRKKCLKYCLNQSLIRDHIRGLESRVFAIVLFKLYLMQLGRKGYEYLLD